MNVIIDLFVKGGPLMWPLLVCSLCSLTVSLERLFFWLRERARLDPALVSEVLRLEREGKTDAALKLLEKPGKHDMTARLLRRGLMHGGGEPGLHLEQEAARLISGCKRGLRVLETVIAISPLLGILGTVMGIIDSFNILGAQGMTNPQGVVSGIAVALITTAFGLFIAIITIVPYNIFLHLVQKQAEKLEHSGSLLQALLEKGPVR
jgi:biopolymer transport protein ExbB